MKEMITVATFNERDKAEALQHRLTAAGVPADVYDESTLQSTLFVTKKHLAHMRVQVDKKDMDRAEKLLAEWEPEGALRDAVRCPECGSSRIEYPQFTRKFLTPAVFAYLSKVGLVKPEFYCENCHFTWPPDAEKMPDLDTLYWPKDDKKRGPLGPY
jgi:putative signal transducing protein